MSCKNMVASASAAEAAQEVIGPDRQFRILGQALGTSMITHNTGSKLAQTCLKVAPLEGCELIAFCKTLNLLQGRCGPNHGPDLTATSHRCSYVLKHCVCSTCRSIEIFGLLLLLRHCGAISWMHLQKDPTLTDNLSRFVLRVHDFCECHVVSAYAEASEIIFWQLPSPRLAEQCVQRR